MAYDPPKLTTYEKVTSTIGLTLFIAYIGGLVWSLSNGKWKQDIPEDEQITPAKYFQTPAQITAWVLLIPLFIGWALILGEGFVKMVKPR